MLRLIIVDDERIIRETICNQIDWNYLGIEVVGVCSNGIEAYHCIIDEYPDIVLTDIKMPGLSGLQLIERIQKLDKTIEFIILSGYSEFEYAKEAMKYGVKHYLLKPCNEREIIDVVKNVSNEYYKKIMIEEENNKQSYQLEHSIINSILLEYLTQDSQINLFIHRYEDTINFNNNSYSCIFIHFVEEKNIPELTSILHDFFHRNYNIYYLYSIYVNNTYIIFFSDKVKCSDLNNLLSSIHFSNEKVSISTQVQNYNNLTSLLEELHFKVKRYDKIYLISDEGIIPILIHANLIKNTDSLIKQLENSSNEKQNIIYKLTMILEAIHDVDFIKSISKHILLNASNQLNLPFHNNQNLSDSIDKIEKCNSAKIIASLTKQKLTELISISDNSKELQKDYITRLIQYVNNNLSNSELTLKWIAENYLYMNVDYLSKQFYKETGQKFSSYLTNARIEAAKKILEDGGIQKISSVANDVGCGNNPLYFSQLFKKCTGMSPSTYVKNIS